MKVLLIALVLVLHACSAAQQDGGSLEVGNQTANEANIGNTGMPGDEMQNSLLSGDESFNNPTGNLTENSNLPVNDALNANQGLDTDTEVPPVDSPTFTGGEAVRYVNRDDVNAYAQPDSSSNIVATLTQGECVLANISGEFAETRHGFIAVSDLSEALQPRSFVGNDWR
ncbi:MAG: hypothetical protein OYH77_01215 [Pseudomonadota bacterium]|nr:hypothetical protein [Pseudomonadota bacterium]